MTNILHLKKTKNIFKKQYKTFILLIIRLVHMKHTPETYPTSGNTLCKVIYLLFSYIDVLQINSHNIYFRGVCRFCNCL